MDALINLLLHTLSQVWVTFTHNWPFLIVSVLAAVGLKLCLDPQKVSAFLLRHKNAGVIGATAAAVGTPLCSCGTTAVILGMMASMIPWAPIVAFMVASPLTSPEELIYSAGLFGWPFAIAFFASSIVLGLVGGLAAGFMESRGWLKNQNRMTAPASPIRAPARTAAPSRILITRPEKAQPNLAPSHMMASARAFGLLTPEPAAAACSCSVPAAAAVVSAPPAACACAGSSQFTSATPDSRLSADSNIEPLTPSGLLAHNPSGATDTQLSTHDTRSHRVTPRLFLEEAFTTGKRLLLMFFGFAFFGYFLNGLIPAAWISTLFGGGNVYSVPLAATLGLPLYINSEASLPLVRAMLDGGMSQGAALAFLITGAGTSIGAIAGALTIARWRVIALVIGTLWAGAIAMGLIYDLLLSGGIL